MRVITVRGTSGSGKSTLVRKVTALYPSRLACFEPGRRQPIANVHSCGLIRPLYVPGHYETACGGCDTIPTPDKVYELVRAGLAIGYDIMYEGIIVQDDNRRLLELNREHPVNVIELTTSIGECLLGIQARRNARGDERPLNPKNTVNRAKTVHRGCEKLRDAGLVVPIMSRGEAFQYCLLLLEIKEKE